MIHWTLDQGELHELRGSKVVRMVTGEVSQDRHAVVLQLPVTERSGGSRSLEQERLQQELPVRGDGRDAVLGDEAQGMGGVAVIGAREHLSLRVAQFHEVRAVAAIAALIPETRIGTREAEEH